MAVVSMETVPHTEKLQYYLAEHISGSQGPMWDLYGAHGALVVLIIFCGSSVAVCIPDCLVPSRVLVPAPVSPLAGAVQLVVLAKTIWIAIPEGPMRGANRPGLLLKV